MKKLTWFAAALLTLLLLVALVVALVLTTVSFEIDATPYKGRIVADVKGRTGWDLRVDGKLLLRLGPKLGVRAERVTLSVPDGHLSGELADIEGLSLSVDTLALLQGNVEPHLLELSGARVSLKRDRSGHGNWQPQWGGTGSEDGAEPGGTTGMALRTGEPVTRLRDLKVEYTEPGWKAPLRIEVRSADVSPSRTGLDIELDASVDGQPLRLTGTTATLTQLLEGAEPLPLDLSGDLLGLRVTAKGTVANPWSGAQVKASLRLEGASLAGLRPWVGEVVAARGPVKARLDLEGGGDSYRLAPFELTIGEGRFDGALAIDLSSKTPRLDLDLGVEEVDLTPLLDARRAVGSDRGAGEGPAPVALFSDDPLPTAWMDAADVQARIRLRNLITPYTSMQDTDIDASLSGRHLSVEIRGKADGGRSDSLDFALDARGRSLAVFLRYRGKKLLLERLVEATSARSMFRGDWDLSADFNASGTSSNRLASSLHGRLLFLVEHAQADLSQLHALTPGLQTLLGQLAKPRSQMAEVNCALAAFEFQGGKSSIGGLVDTRDSTVVAEGKLDLGSETLRLRLVPKAKGVHLKVAAPVVIRGTLTDLDYEVEKGELLVSITELASKIAVPSLLLVDVFGDAVAENPCVKIAAGGVDEQKSETEELLTKPVEGVVKGAGAVVEGTGRVLKEAGGALLKGVGKATEGLFGSGKHNGAAASGDAPEQGSGPFLEAE